MICWGIWDEVDDWCVRTWFRFLSFLFDCQQQGRQQQSGYSATKMVPPLHLSLSFLVSATKLIEEERKELRDSERKQKEIRGSRERDRVGHHFTRRCHENRRVMSQQSMSHVTPHTSCHTYEWLIDMPPQLSPPALLSATQEPGSVLSFPL